MVEVAFVHEAHGPCPFCMGYDQHMKDCDHKDMSIEEIMAWWADHGTEVSKPVGILWCEEFSYPYPSGRCFEVPKLDWKK